MLRLLASILLCTAALAVAQESASQPVLRWAADPDSNAPYTFYGSDNKLTGFEYEIINAIARHMGREAKFVQNDWDGLIPASDAMYDVVILRHRNHSDKAGGAF